MDASRIAQAIAALKEGIAEALGVPGPSRPLQPTKLTLRQVISHLCVACDSSSLHDVAAFMKELDTTATLPKELNAAALPKELELDTVLQDPVAAALPRPKKLDTTATLRKELDTAALPNELDTCTAVFQDPVAALQKELDIATLHPSEEPDEREFLNSISPWVKACTICTREAFFISFQQQGTSRSLWSARCCSDL